MWLLMCVWIGFCLFMEGLAIGRCKGRIEKKSEEDTPRMLHTTFQLNEEAAFPFEDLKQEQQELIRWTRNHGFLVLHDFFEWKHEHPGEVYYE